MMNVGISEQLTVPSDALNCAFLPIADCLPGPKESHRDGF
jgi:hypothetical protein